MSAVVRVLVSCVLYIGVLAWISGCASSGRTTAGNALVNDLVVLLDGEFDSGVQMHEDRLRRVAAAQAHGWVNRAFVEVDAPAIGGTVLVGSTRYRGPPWTVDEDEFLVWTLQADELGESVVMVPRRFINYKSQLPHARDAQQLSGLTPDNLESAVSGAACTIVWRRSTEDFPAAASLAA